MHEDIFAVLARNETKTLRVVEPLHGTLFHCVRISWIELRWRNRSHWQNLALMGELLLTPGSFQTLILLYHPRQKLCAGNVCLHVTCVFLLQNPLTNMGLGSINSARSPVIR
jgi:hypothetical protein